MENQANSKNIILNYGFIRNSCVLIELLLYAGMIHLRPHWS